MFGRQGRLYVRDMNNNNMVIVQEVASDRVVFIPTFGMFALYMNDRKIPVWVDPGTIADSKGVLKYLATVGAADSGDGLHWGASSDLHICTLTRHMTATDIAQLTGFSIELVREVLRNYLAFERADQ